MEKKRPIHISTHYLYFERIFEPQRKKLEKKLKIPLSQTRYTELLARKSLGIKIPKNFNKLKRRRISI
jgi:hypothetical protein